jgi:hypothetical protein
MFNPLTGPAATTPRTNVLAVGVERFIVRVFDGAQWQKTWPIEKGPPCPEAAEIEIVVRSGREARRLNTRVFIPAGESFHSSFERSAATSPR